MQGLSICHYSFHRIWKEEAWDCTRLAEQVRSLGAEGIDFHQRLTGDPQTAARRIRDAVQATGLVLTGLSLSNNFNQSEASEMNSQVEDVSRWLRIAAEVGAPVSRIFGGHISDRGDHGAVQAALDRVRAGLERVLPIAEETGVILAPE